MRFPTGVSLWAAALVVSSCGGGEPSPASSVAQQQTAWAVKLEPLTLPVSGTTSQPQLTLSERGLILSWMQQQDASFALMFAERSSAAWSPSRTVATSTEWFVSEADVPTVMRMRDGTLVATTYPATDLRLEAYELRLSYSRDDGKSWEIGRAHV